MVKFHRGPAAVIGDETRNNHLWIVWVPVNRRLLIRGEGAVSRLIRKPEDLPVVVELVVVPSEIGRFDPVLRARIRRVSYRRRRTPRFCPTIDPGVLTQPGRRVFLLRRRRSLSGMSSRRKKGGGCSE